MIQQVRSLNNAGRIRYFISVLNPLFGDNFTEFARGSNADNEEMQEARSWNYGADMPEHFEQDLKRVLENENIAKVIVRIAGGDNKDKVTYDLVLREQYANHQPIAQHKPEEKPQPVATQQPALGALGDLNAIISGLFGGLGGPEQTGLGAIMGFRDQIMKNEYDRRDMEREHQQKEQEIRNEYERAEHAKTVNSLREEGVAMKSRIAELEGELAKAKADIEKRDTQIEELEDQVEELEKMKPDNSIMGIAISGALAKAGDMLLHKHAGAVGKLLGVDKSTMLGMLDEEPETEPMEQPAATADIPPVSLESAEEDDQITTAAKEIAGYINTLTDDDKKKFVYVMRAAMQHLDEMAEQASEIMSE